MASRTTFNFDKKAAETLEALAEKKGVSATEIVRRALALYDYIEQVKGPQVGSVTIEKEGGQKVDVVLP